MCWLGCEIGGRLFGFIVCGGGWGRGRKAFVRCGEEVGEASAGIGEVWE